MTAEPEIKEPSMEDPVYTVSQAGGKWLCAAACAMALLLTCTPEFNNPLDPDNPEAFTLWYKVLSDSLPDTLHYGAAADFIVNFGDEDGDVVSVTVSGLPQNQLPSIFQSGEATSVSFRLTWDSLALDSTYTITLLASGEEPVDTLTLRYTLHVADTINPDTSTLWYQLLSDSLPDTLHYGASAVFILNVGDNDGDSVSVTVSGLPQSQLPSIFPSGNATAVSFNLKGDSLAFDSTYTITLSASGEETMDTLTLRYALRVADTTRLGGVKKLKIGMWWIEMEYDTTDFEDRDSSGLVDTSGTALTEHRLAHRVVDTLKRGADLYYVIRKVDSVKNESALKIDTLLVKHSDFEVSFAISPDSGSDTLFLKFLSLPLTLGLQWTVMDTSQETFFPITGWVLGIMRFWVYSVSATEAMDTVRHPVGGHDYPCLDLATTDSNYSLMTAFGDLVIPVVQTVVVDSGDTIGFSRAEASTRTFYNTSLTVPLWSHKVTTGLDTNYLDRTSHRYTSRRETFLTMFYDPWLGDTVLTK
jgi:hypothetical protein